MIRDDDFMAYASTGNVLVVDAEDAAARTPPELMGAWISAYVPVAGAAADHLAEATTTLRIQAGGLLVALGVLLATALGMAQIHTRANAQAILVRYLHGWSFLRTHRWLIVAEVVLVVAVATWSVSRLVNVLTLQAGGDTGGASLHGTEISVAMWQPVAAALVSVLNLAVLVAMVLARTRQMVRTRSEEPA